LAFPVLSFTALLGVTQIKSPISDLPGKPHPPPVCLGLKAVCSVITEIRWASLPAYRANAFPTFFAHVFAGAVAKSGILLLAFGTGADRNAHTAAVGMPPAVWLAGLAQLLKRPAEKHIFFLWRDGSHGGLMRTATEGK
jgi:hypothetical protein